jgi:thiosulfate reductase cytochrome b subunit
MTAESISIPTTDATIHPGWVRACHWINAFAILVMVGSGWQIYDASPLVDFLTFPRQIALGNWLAGALLWHFAAMWLLFLSLPVFVAWAFWSGHFRMRYLPVTAREVASNVTDFFRGRLSHDLGVRNAVQKLLYAFALLAMLAMVLSGLVLWKPVQLHTLGLLMGQYEGARYVHFFGMAGIVLFIVVHIALTLLVPKVLLPMITGRALRRPEAIQPTGDAS